LALEFFAGEHNQLPILTSILVRGGGRIYPSKKIVGFRGIIAGERFTPTQNLQQNNPKAKDIALFS
jgi:hypothetical protein